VRRRLRVTKRAYFLIEERKKMGEHAKRVTHHIASACVKSGI